MRTAKKIYLPMQYIPREYLIEAIQFENVDDILAWAIKHVPGFEFDTFKSIIIVPAMQKQALDFAIDNSDDDDFDSSEDGPAIMEMVAESPCDMVCNKGDYLVLNSLTMYVNVVRKDIFENMHMPIKIIKNNQS